MITSIGGTVLDSDEGFMFSIPVREANEVVPKLRQFNVACERVQEFVTTNPHSGRTEIRIVLRAVKALEAPQGGDRMERLGKL